MQAFNALWTLLIYYIYIFAFILMCAQLWPTRTHTHTHCTAMHSHSNNQITLKHTFIASIYCCLPFEFVAIFSIFQFNGISPFFSSFFLFIYCTWKLETFAYLCHATEIIPYPYIYPCAIRSQRQIFWLHFDCCLPACT